MGRYRSGTVAYQERLNYTHSLSRSPPLLAFSIRRYMLSDCRLLSLPVANDVLVKKGSYRHWPHIESGEKRSQAKPITVPENHHRPDSVHSMHMKPECAAGVGEGCMCMWILVVSRASTLPPCRHWNRLWEGIEGGISQPRTEFTSTVISQGNCQCFFEFRVLSRIIIIKIIKINLRSSLLLLGSSRPSALKLHRSRPVTDKTEKIIANKVDSTDTWIPFSIRYIHYGIVENKKQEKK